jgi:hypothetical protein
MCFGGTECLSHQGRGSALHITSTCSPSAIKYILLLQAKKEIYDVKQQRLYLAQDEYNHLHNALTTLNTSRTSCKYIISKVLNCFVLCTVKLRDFVGTVVHSVRFHNRYY